MVKQLNFAKKINNNILEEKILKSNFGSSFISLLA
jgi:hypothetical protein